MLTSIKLACRHVLGCVVWAGEIRKGEWKCSKEKFLFSLLDMRMVENYFQPIVNELHHTFNCLIFFLYRSENYCMIFSLTCATSKKHIPVILIAMKHGYEITYDTSMIQQGHGNMAYCTFFWTVSIMLVLVSDAGLILVCPTILQYVFLKQKYRRSNINKNMKNATYHILWKALIF